MKRSGESVGLPGERDLSRAESLRLLNTVRVGRIVFTRDALPAVRPVYHRVEGDSVIIYGHLGMPFLSALGTVVAYEADGVDPDGTLNWGVIVTGVARPARANGASDAGYGQRVARIHAELVTGFTRVDPPR